MSAPAPAPAAAECAKQKANGGLDGDGPTSKDREDMSGCAVEMSGTEDLSGRAVQHCGPAEHIGLFGQKDARSQCHLPLLQ